MKKISYQAFKKDPGKYLKEDVEIQMFGKPHARISPVEKQEPQKKIKFDYDSYRVCGQCEKPIPVILLPFHMSVIHGM